MKTTIIKLFPEQIEQLIEAERELLLIEKEKAIKKAENTFNNEVKTIEKNFESSIEKLKKKYENLEIEIGDNIKKPEPTKKTRIPDEQIKVLFEMGTTVKDIALQTGKTEVQIRQKLHRMKLKIKDRI